jgi:hypothetical protein
LPSRFEASEEADIPYIMATERMVGYEDRVGRWDLAKHRAALVDGRHATFIARDESGPVGFAILRDWGSPERVTLIKRIAVSRPGVCRPKGRRGALCVDSHKTYYGIFTRREFVRFFIILAGLASGVTLSMTDNYPATATGTVMVIPS